MDLESLVSPVTNMGFACHGSLLVTVTLTGCLRVLDKCSGYTVSKTLQTMSPAVVSVSTENSLVAICDDGGKIQIWDIVTGALVYETDIVMFGVVTDLFDIAISPNGQNVVVMLPNLHPSRFKRGNFLWLYHLPSDKTYFTGVFRPWDYLDKLFCDNRHVRVPTTGAMGTYMLPDGENYESYMICTRSPFSVTQDDVLVAFISLKDDKLRIMRYTRARNRFEGAITFAF